MCQGHSKLSTSFVLNVYSLPNLWELPSASVTLFFHWSKAKEMEEGSAGVSWYESQLLIGQSDIFHQLVWTTLFWVISRPGPQASTSGALTWIQCKLGEQYLWKKVTLPWESNPEPTPIRGDIATNYHNSVCWVLKMKLNLEIKIATF